MRFLGYALGDESVPMRPPTPELMAEMDAFMELGALAGRASLTPHASERQLLLARAAARGSGPDGRPTRVPSAEARPDLGPGSELAGSSIGTGWVRTGLASSSHD